MGTPFSWLAERVVLGPRALRWGTTAALVTSILIVLGGGVVRVTGSGLGCPTWPTCDGTNLAPIPELGVHGLIEFGNRLVTGLLILAVGWAIVAARLQRPRDRMLTRLAWSQFWLVVANAIAGGITVLVELNPWVVALHFVLAVGLLATATLTWQRARDAGEERPAPTRAGRTLAWALALLTLGVVVVGTLVSGSGPHSGDSSAVPRMGLDWTVVAWVHALLAAAVGVLAVALLVLERRVPGSRARLITFLLVYLAQGAIGGIQSLIGLPELLVALHVLGSALVWVGALRVLLEVDSGLFRVRTVGREPSDVAAEPAATAV